MHECDEKRAAVEKLTEMIRGAESMIVTDYRGLSVGQLADVRNQLREAGASLTVAKNTLARIAAGQADKPDLVALLQGPTAIAFVSDDPAGGRQEAQRDRPPDTHPAGAWSDHRRRDADRRRGSAAR